MAILKTFQRKSANLAHIEVYLDDISDISTESIEGLTEGIDIEPGSIAYDANGNVAIYKTNGTWGTVN